MQGGSPLAGASARLVPSDALNPWAMGGTTEENLFRLVDVAYQSEQKTPTTISVAAEEESVRINDVGAAIKKQLPKL